MAYPQTIEFKLFAQISAEVGAIFFVVMAHNAEIVAAGLHPNPLPHAHYVTTTTHKTLRDQEVVSIVCRESWAQAIDKAIFPRILQQKLLR